MFLFAASLFLSLGPLSLELSLRSGHSSQVKYGGALSLALALSTPVSVSNTNIEDENSQSCSWEDQQDDSSDCRQDLDHSPYHLNALFSPEPGAVASPAPYRPGTPLIPVTPEIIDLTTVAIREQAHRQLVR